jgi:hypothetical protein
MLGRKGFEAHLSEVEADGNEASDRRISGLASSARGLVSQVGIIPMLSQAYSLLNGGKVDSARRLLEHIEDRVLILSTAAEAASRAMHDLAAEADYKAERVRAMAKRNLRRELDDPTVVEPATGTTRPEGADPRTVPALSGQSHPDPSVSNVAALAMGKIPPADAQAISDANQEEGLAEHLHPKNMTAADGRSPVATDEQAEAAGDFEKTGDVKGALERAAKVEPLDAGTPMGEGDRGGVRGPTTQEEIEREAGQGKAADKEGDKAKGDKAKGSHKAK